MELKSISKKLIKSNNDINFSYIEDFDSIFLNGSLLINFFKFHSLSSEEGNKLIKMAKIFFSKEKLLILFWYEKKIFGQIGKISNTDGDNIFDIDYLISIKNNISNNYGTIFSIHNIFKDEEDYNNFCQNIYNNLNQDNLFEYKISDELILNILNFKRYKGNNYYFSANDNKQIESRNIKK